MLKEILKPEECAACRICCWFDDDDLWESPLTCTEKINDLYRCPELGQKGCLLGNEKPFSCQVWPFRVMSFHGILVITLSTVCPSVQKQPLKAILDFLHGGLGEKMLTHAKTHPETVIPYRDGLPILMTGE